MLIILQASIRGGRWFVFWVFFWGFRMCGVAIVGYPPSRCYLEIKLCGLSGLLRGVWGEEYYIEDVLYYIISRYLGFGLACMDTLFPWVVPKGGDRGLCIATSKYFVAWIGMDVELLLGSLLAMRWPSPTFGSSWSILEAAKHYDYFRNALEN